MWKISSLIWSPMPLACVDWARLICFAWGFWLEACLVINSFSPIFLLKKSPPIREDTIFFSSFHLLPGLGLWSLKGFLDWHSTLQGPQTSPSMLLHDLQRYKLNVPLDTYNFHGSIQDLTLMKKQTQNIVVLATIPGWRGVWAVGGGTFGTAPGVICDPAVRYGRLLIWAPQFVQHWGPHPHLITSSTHTEVLGTPAFAIWGHNDLFMPWKSI